MERQAMIKEMKQLHDRECFRPIDISELTRAERRKAQLALGYLAQKNDGRIKGRTVYNGKPTREWLSKEDSASPTASLESIFITGVIDAKEERDIMVTDVPNAFIQTTLSFEEGRERIIMKITGSLVDVLLEISPATYAQHVVMENGKKGNLRISYESNLRNVRSSAIMV